MSRTKREHKVRAGDTVPYRKGTAEEVERRVEFVAGMMANQKTKWQIHDAFREGERRAARLGPGDPRYWFHRVHWRQVDVYIAKARDWLLKRCKKTKMDALLESVGYWESVIRDPKAQRMDKMHARKQLDKIFGTHAPTQVRVTTPPGQPMETKAATEDRPLRSITTDRLLELAGFGDQKKERQ